MQARRLFFAVNNLPPDEVGRRWAEADEWFSRNRLLLREDCETEFLEFLNAVSIRDVGAEEAIDVLRRYNTLVEAHRSWASDLLKGPSGLGAANA